MTDVDKEAFACARTPRLRLRQYQFLSFYLLITPQAAKKQIMLIED